MAASRALRPTEERGSIEARNNAFLAMQEGVESRVRIWDLCRIAFQLPIQDVRNLSWFEGAMKAADSQFTMQVDAVEAGLVASLMLREKIEKGNSVASLAVLM